MEEQALDVLYSGSLLCAVTGGVWESFPGCYEVPVLQVVTDGGGETARVLVECFVLEY